MNTIDVRAAITRAHRDEWARVVAGLTRRFGDLDIAEEAAAEAFATAVGRWPTDGVPPNPGAWLNRSIAVAELDGPEVALATVDRLEGKLAGYHAFHATRADLLRRLGRRVQGARGVRQGHRAGGQHRRDRRADAPP